MITIAVARLGLPAQAVAWLLANAADLGWAELDHLPYDPGQPPVAFGAWQRLQGFLSLLAAYPRVTGFFAAVLAAPSATDLLGYLAARTGTDPAVLLALDGHLGLSTPDVSAYRDPATVSELLGTVAVLRTLGLDVPTAIEVTKPVLGPSDATRMRLALKARYADAGGCGPSGSGPSGSGLSVRGAPRRSPDERVPGRRCAPQASTATGSACSSDPRSASR
jgi:hypothetical protein